MRHRLSAFQFMAALKPLSKCYTLGQSFEATILVCPAITMQYSRTKGGFVFIECLHALGQYFTSFKWVVHKLRNHFWGPRVLCLFDLRVSVTTGKSSVEMVSWYL